MTVEQLKDKMRAEGMDPDKYDTVVRADGTVDFVEKSCVSKVTATTNTRLTSSKK